MDKPQAFEIRWWDLPSAVLLMAAMLIAAARLIATRWTSELTVTQMVVAFGVIAGLALGKSLFSPRLAGILSVLYGLFVVPWQIGSTIRADILWTERFSILSNRLGLIFYQLFNREPVQDSLLFLISMSILFWILGVLAGYTLVRYGNAWKAVIPAGLTLFVIHTFDPLITRRTWYLAAYLFFSLILIARTVFLHRQNRWQRSRTTLPAHLGFDFVRFAVIASLVIVLFSWTVPALASALPAAQKAWRPVRDAWNDTKTNFENAFASLRSTVGIVSEVYGDSASLGIGNPLSQALVFTVEPDNTLPVGVRVYWRARTYDNYTDGRWLSTVNSTHDFDPQDDELDIPEGIGRWTGTFTFTTATSPSTLFVPAQPLWVDRPGQIEYAQNSDGTLDISTFRAIPGLQPGQEYNAIASLNNATIAQLRDAGEEYPDYIVERYLQLPDSISARTRNLAEDITADLVTPYDKAVAITSYLRQNITYVDTLPQVPPNDQDIIDWFLFDLQQGFCNYYSTAEIVLLRSLGIPARWAVGYARGEIQDEVGMPISYIVRHNDAHAWPEVYFPDIGWVEFEPTAAQPEIARLSGDLGNDPEIDPLTLDQSQQMQDEFEQELAELRRDRINPEFDQTQTTRLTVVYWALAIVVGAGLLFLGWRLRNRINVHATPIILVKAFRRIGIRPPEALLIWARKAALPPLPRAYLEINHALTRLGRKPILTETPNERAINLGQVLPKAKLPADHLVYEYQLATFSRKSADLDIAIGASKEIRNLSLRAYLQRLLTRLQQRPRRKRPGQKR